jgi:hypothetical protein
MILCAVSSAYWKLYRRTRAISCDISTVHIGIGTTYVVQLPKAKSYYATEDYGNHADGSIG